MQIVTRDSSLGRVGFIVPRWTPKGNPERQGVPFRSIPVAGALHRAGWEVVFFDQECDVDRRDRTTELRAALSNARAVFVWQSELDPMIQTRNTLAIARTIKAWYPELPTIAGGAFLTLVPPTGLEPGDGVDYFVRGQGERAAVDLLERLDDQGRLHEVSGLVWRDGDRIRANPVHTRQRIDARDLAFYRRLDLEEHVQRGGIFGNGEPTLIFATANGCPKACAFCYWRNFEPSMLPPDEIVALAEHLRGRYGVRQFHIAELDFATNRKRVLRFADLWRERLPDSRWFALMSPVDAIRFSDADWDRLRSGGCLKIELGTESGAPDVIARIGKRHAPDDAVTIAERAFARGIATMHNFVFGTPGETAADRRRSLRLIRRLQRIDPDWISFTFRFYQPTWDTPMGDVAIAATPDFPANLRELLAWRPLFGDPDVRAMPWLAPREERTIKRMALYYLPMTTSKLVLEPPLRRALYRALRAIARLRVRAGWFGLGIDRWLWGRFVRGRLDDTYQV